MSCSTCRRARIIAILVPNMFLDWYSTVFQLALLQYLGFFARLHIDIGMVFLLETLRCKLHSRHAFPSRKENAMVCIISVRIPSKFLSRLDFGTCFIFLLWVYKGSYINIFQGV